MSKFGSKLKVPARIVKPAQLLTVGLMCSALLAACGMQHDLSDMHDATMDMRTQTTEMNGRMKGMSDTTDGMSKTTGGMAKTTDDMAKTTNHMSQTTDGLDQKTAHLAATTDQMAKTTGEMAQVTSGMAVTTNHMAETTDAMSKNMQDMKARTDELSATSNRLDSKTASLYNDLKQDNANKARQEGLKLVLSVKETPHKVSEATKYFWAFEFQVWSGQGEDTPEKRMALAGIGAREFLNDISECMGPGQTEVNPLAFNQVAYIVSNPYGNQDLCFNAVAVALHEVNIKQTILLQQHPELKKLSMLSLIEAAFRAKVEMVEKGKQLDEYPQFVTEVLMRQNVAALLLQARYNFEGTMVLGLTTNIQNGIMTGLNMTNNPFAMDLSAKNPAELLEVTTYLKDAIALRDFMIKVGLKPKLDSKLLSILKNATLLDTSAQSEFNKFFENYRSGGATAAVKVAVPAAITAAKGPAIKPPVLVAPVKTAAPVSAPVVAPVTAPVSAQSSESAGVLPPPPMPTQEVEQASVPAVTASPTPSDSGVQKQSLWSWIVEKLTPTKNKPSWAGQAAKMSAPPVPVDSGTATPPTDL